MQMEYSRQNKKEEEKTLGNVWEKSFTSEKPFPVELKYYIITFIGE